MMARNTGCILMGAMILVAFPSLTYAVSRQNMHLAQPGANTCEYGSVVQSECEAASQIFATKAGFTPERSMQVGSGGKCLDGSWGQVPLGCSVQSGGDWTPHYKTGNLSTGVGCIHEHYQLVCYDSAEPMEVCIAQCKKNACEPDIDERKGCNQMYSCSHACKMRQLGVSKANCGKQCIRNGQSGCSPQVKGYRFELCGSCKRQGCPTWPSVKECLIGCNSYPGCNWQSYLDRYTDLQKALGTNNVKAAEKHWREYGKREGRDCYKRGT